MGSMRGMVNKGLQVGRLLSRNQGFKGFHNFPSNLTTLTSNQTDAALSITKHVFLKEEFKNKNVVFSPLSLHVALSMVAAGAEGPTLNELLTFLRAKSTNDLNSLASQLASVLRDGARAGGPRLCFANGLWVEQSLPLLPSFKQLVNTDYKATLASADFVNKGHKVANEVNLWAETKTNGLIENLLPPGSVDSLTRLILANALYFKGAWKDKFDAFSTEEGDFHLLNSTSVKVPFMSSEEDQLIGVFDGFKVAGLPYKHGKDKRRFSMYIFLPDANDGLSTLVEQETSGYEFVERHLPHKKVEVGDFRIPSFKFSLGLNLFHMLNEMGLVLPFSARDANLTKIMDPFTSKERLFVSNIIQKSFIEVNEEGTEAAAVTAAMGFGCAMSYTYSNVIDFVADHPFLFMIRENLTGTMLFIGQVLHPLHR